MDDDQQRRILAETTQQASELLAFAWRERDNRRATGRNVERLDRFIADFAPIVAELLQVDTQAAITEVIERHGPGPWPVEDLAAISGRNPEMVERVLEALSEDEA